MTPDCRESLMPIDHDSIETSAMTHRGNAQRFIFNILIWVSLVALSWVSVSLVFWSVM